MKRWIHATTELEEQGFLLNVGNKDFFYRSNASNTTDKIVRIFINKVCDVKGVGDAIRQSALYNEATLKDFKRRIQKATLEHIVTDKVSYYKISGKGFSSSFPEDEFDQWVVVI